MKYLTIEYIKANSRICCDCENEILEEKAKAAETATLLYINKTYDELIEEYGEFPDPIREATLMLVDHLYQHRGISEPISYSGLSYNYDFLLLPYMSL